MKAFLVGLIFLIAVTLLAGVGLLLYPLLLVLAFLLRVLLGLIFAFFAVWVLGKFIIFVWDKFFH